MQIKPFIHISADNFKSIAPIKSGQNKYGVDMYFYLINNANLEDFKNQSSFKKDFKEQKQDDLEWFLNRWAVFIVSTDHLMNKFLAKNTWDLIQPENWTSTTVVK